MDYARFLGVDTVAIFLFHGVITGRRRGVRNYTNKHLMLDRFVAVLHDLLEHGHAVSMPDLVQTSRDGRPLSPGAFAVTFDDGFANNHAVAAPVLLDLHVPATFYVTTGFIAENGCSWIDHIEAAMEAVGAFELALPFVGSRRVATDAEKIALLDAIRRHVKSDPSIDPYAFADDIVRRLGVTSLPPDPDLDQKMSWGQVRELSAEPLFAIGGHGHTHRILEFLDQKELEHEVAVSLDALRTNVHVPVAHYSYPEGLANCYSDRVIAVLRQHGIVCAPTAEPGVNRSGDDPFRLKRIMVTE